MRKRRRRRAMQPKRAKRTTAVGLDAAGAPVFADVYSSDDSADTPEAILHKRRIRRALAELPRWEGPLPLGHSATRRRERRGAARRLLRDAGLLKPGAGSESDDESASDEDEAEGDEDEDEASSRKVCALALGFANVGAGMVCACIRHLSTRSDFSGTHTTATSSCRAHHNVCYNESRKRQQHHAAEQRVALARCRAARRSAAAAAAAAPASPAAGGQRPRSAVSCVRWRAAPRSAGPSSRCS